MSKSRFNTRQLALAGIIAGIYAGLTLVLPIPQYHGIQLRVAEAMTLLPFLFPAAIPGLVVGCFLANLLGRWHRPRPPGNSGRKEAVPYRYPCL